MSFLILVVFLICQSALAEVIPAATKPLPILFKADRLEYNKNLDTIHASGNVEASQEISKIGTRVLYADQLVYSGLTKKIVAQGNVILMEPSGDIIFADYFNFSDDFKDGFIRTVKVLMADQSRIAAHSSERIGETTTVFDKAVYSPCNICRKNPNKPPLWQLKAKEVINDEVEQTVVYKDATFEFYGVPVFYTPYFRHPSPTVKKKSGFLAPRYGTTVDLGAMLSVPVFYNIDSNRDLTLTPMTTTNQGPIISGEYRHCFLDGEAKINSSYTQTRGLKDAAGKSITDPKKERWHLLSQGRYELSDERLFTFDINRASDTTYLRRYPVMQQNPSFAQIKNLTSTGAVEQFRDNSYVGVKGYAFQTDAPKTTPSIFPLAVFSYQTDPDRMGGVWNVDGNALALRRDQVIVNRTGKEMQRLSLGSGWKRPYITPRGDVWTVNLTARADGYSVRDFQPNAKLTASNSSYNNGGKTFTGRLFPQASLDWRYPLVKSLERSDWVLEPMAMVIASPHKNKDSKIPNEDSQTVEIDDVNTFMANRFNGYDVVDDGYRGVYGLNNTFYFPHQRQISIFLGQTRRLDHHRVIPKGLGENDKESDYIGRLKLRPVNWMTATYRTAVKPGTGRPRMSELGVSLGKPILTLSAGYVFLTKNSMPSQQDISQVNWQLSSQVTEQWKISVAQIKNLKNNRGGALANFLSATYQDECFQIIGGVYKTAYRDRDIRPDSGFLVQLNFKNLGILEPITAPQYPGSMLTAFDHDEKKDGDKPKTW
jgi:LPS-assembly protein